MPIPAASPSPNPQKPLGRPPGRRSSYYIQLEKMAAKKAGLLDGVLADPLLPLAQCVVVTGLSLSTLRRLIYTRVLPAQKTTPRTGHWRVRLSSLRALGGNL